MDVHRARFVPYPTHAVTAVALSSSRDVGNNSQSALRLAVGRQNGAVEIWSICRGRWVQEVVLQDDDDRSIDGLIWTQDGDETYGDGTPIAGQHRLFSISGLPAVTEWDLGRGTHKKQSSGNFGEVWCFAAQPRAQSNRADSNESSSSQDIVAGCADGTLVLLSTSDNELAYKRILARVSGKKTKCMSITYQTRERIIAGFTDGTIRVYDTKRDTCIRTMNLGASLPGAPKNVYVWQVKCLPNGDVVSGDSNGNITFWDGRTYSSSQRIAAHENDCLDIVTAADGKTIFSGSIDGRVAVIRYGPGLAGRNMWTKLNHRTIHKGDIKSMAAFDGKDMSFVISGGSDSKLVMTPLREYGRAANSTLPHLPQRPAVASARQARLLVSWWDKTISIWRMARKPGADAESQPPRKLVAKMTLNTKHNLESVCISDDGRAIAASTRDEIKMFQLRRRLDTDALAIRKVDLPRELATASSRLMSFSPDGKWLAAVNASNDILIARTSSAASNPKRMTVLENVVELERSDRQTDSSSSFAKYQRTVIRLAFAPDSSVLAVGDISGYIDSWVLEGHEDTTSPAIDIARKDSKAQAEDDSDSDDSDDDEMIVFYGQHWADNPRGHLLPRLTSMPLVLTFRPASTALLLTNGHGNGNPGVHATRHNPHAHSNELPSGPHNLVVMTAQHELYDFDLLAGRLSEWSQRNPSTALPANLRKLQDRVMGAIWDVKSGRERLWLYGASWMFMLNLAADLADSADSERDVTSKKRRGTSTELVTADKPASVGKRRRLSQSSRQQYPERFSGIVKRYEDGAVTEIDLDETGRKHPDGMDVDAEDEETALAEAQLRLAARHAHSAHDLEKSGSAEPSVFDIPHWHTLKYRSILGVVPLGDFESLELDGDDDVPEVVVVERPIETAT